MRAFLIFATLMVAALARPDIGLKLRDQTGYNYQTPSNGGRPSNGGGSQGGRPSHGGSNGGRPSHHGGNGGHNGGGSRNELGGGGGSSLFQGISSYDAPLVSGSPYNNGPSQDLGVPSTGSANFGPSQGSSSNDNFQQGPSTAIDLGGGPVSGPAPVYKQVFQEGAPVITKNFFVHESPDDEDNAEVQDKVKEVRPQKNYKIIFIKAPTYGAYGSGGRYPNFPLSEEKTIVYVLSKKHNDDDANDPNNTPAPPVTSKPEVFFVKYKTKEEAAQAVSKIQESYQDGGAGFSSPDAFSSAFPSNGGNDFAPSIDSGANTPFQNDYLPPRK